MDRPSKKRKYGGKMKHDIKEFIYACGLGKLWLVEQCIDSGVDIHHNDDEAITKAAKYNRMSVCKSLLQNGAYVTEDAITFACHVGGKAILELFRDEGIVFTDQHLLSLIQGGHSMCCKVVLETGLVVSDSNFMLAVKLGHPHIIELLLKRGANVNCYNGEPLMYLCAKDKVSLVQKLIKFNVDVDIRLCSPLQYSAYNNFTALTETLILAGADLRGLEDLHLSEPTLSLVSTLRKSTRLRRLREAIQKPGPVFKWEKLCECGCKEMESLKKQASLLGIPWIDKTKRELCRDLAIWKPAEIVIDPELFDLTGNCLVDLPRWQIIDINGILFNLFDLFSLIHKGHTFCPFTKRPLPLDYITKLEEKYQMLLTKQGFANRNLLLDVASTSLLSKDAILKQRLLNDVWSRLFYPPNVDLILQATDTTIDKMLEKFMNISDFSETNIFSMIDMQVVDDIEYSFGYQKKSAFVDLLTKVVGVTDEFTSTRIETVSMLLQHFSNLVSGDGEVEDLLDFMLLTPDMVTFNLELYYTVPGSTSQENTDAE